MSSLAQIEARVKAAEDAIAEAKKPVYRDGNDPDRVLPNRVPTIRKGESALSSRPFRFTNFLGLVAGQLSREEAKVEFELSGAFRKGLRDTNSMVAEGGANSGFYPLAKSFLPDAMANHPATQELLQSAASGWDYDHDEAMWLRNRILKSYSAEVQKTAMSYLTETIGGSLVAPAEMGELIPLMRNKSAIDRAGARQVALPPQGKWVAPRITGPSSGYWVTENTAITESNPTTGEIAMMAKKLGVLMRIPNELFRMANAATDGLLRDDSAKTLALGYDYACLYGAGSAGQPKGLINYTGTGQLYDYAVTDTPSGVGNNGNTILAQDGYRMSGDIEDRNFDIEGFKWIMRPKFRATVQSLRASAVTANDSAGPFVQGITRTPGDPAGDRWCGYPIVTSSQVRNNQSKGASGAVLTEMFGGVWPEFLQGLYGAVEFAANPYGEATFAADQTLIRGILHCDCVPRYPGAFIWYKQLLMQV